MRPSYKLDKKSGKILVTRPAGREPWRDEAPATASAKKPSPGELRGSYKSGWALLTNAELASGEWSIAFNILGPALARAIGDLSPRSPARTVAEYAEALGEADPDVGEMRALEDEASQFTHVLRARFETALKLAQASGDDGERVIEAYLGDLRAAFALVPKYCLAAVFETLSLIEWER